MIILRSENHQNQWLMDRIDDLINVVETNPVAIEYEQAQINLIAKLQAYHYQATLNQFGQTNWQALVFDIKNYIKCLESNHSVAKQLEYLITTNRQEAQKTIQPVHKNRYLEGSW